MQTFTDLHIPEVVLCHFCGSVGHALNGKCNYCEIKCVDQLETLPQGQAMRGALQQADILSAFQLRRQVAKGAALCPLQGLWGFSV